MAKKRLLMILFLVIGLQLNIISGQALGNFLGSWYGSEQLESPSLSYENRNISIIVNEDGDREGFLTYSSSSQFLFNEDLDWAYHYFGYDKLSDKLIFLRRFITPLGVLGYEELLYNITEWDNNSFTAEYRTEDGNTTHQIGLDLQILDILDFTPSNILLSKNFPNPFNPATSIEVSIDESSSGSLIIFDIKGYEVKTLHNGEFNSGTTKFIWNGLNNNGTPVSGGVYIYRLYLNGKDILSKKMTLLE
tara:strand:+ start:207 stop:950 length:744 start_codon:yes stop_codon:yes gene_type:complete